MKKFGFSVLTLSFLCLLSVSCKKQSAEIAKPVSDAALLAKLTNYNQQHTNAPSARCSGFWSCLGYVASVAGADIIGAGTGIITVKEAAAAIGVATGGTGAVATMVGAGVITGAGASYAAARTASSTYTPDPLKYGNLEILLPEEFSYLSTVGVEHNDVIHNNFYHEEPIATYYEQKGLNEEQVSVLESDIMKNAQAQLQEASKEYTASNFDFKTLSQRLLDQKLVSTSVKDVLDLFMERYTICETKDEMQEVINYYIATVRDSELGTDDKEALMASFMVASQSPFYFLSE